MGLFARKDGPINPAAPSGLPTVSHLLAPRLPAHLDPVFDAAAPSTVYRAPRQPTFGEGDLTSDRKHTARLRDKRLQKARKRRDDADLVKRAVLGDMKAKRALDARQVRKTLESSKNVSFIGKQKRAAKGLSRDHKKSASRNK